MSDKSTILRAFNSHFNDFLDDVVHIYPDDVNILSAKNSFETIKHMNPSLVIKAWHTYIYVPYNEVIEQGNLSFFFDKDYKSDVSHLNNSDEILQIIDKIREPLRNMTDTNKEKACGYLKNLTKLSNVYKNL